VAKRTEPIAPSARGFQKEKRKTKEVGGGGVKQREQKTTAVLFMSGDFIEDAFLGGVPQRELQHHDQGNAVI